MEWARSSTVAVWNVSANDGTQPREVEVGVFQLQRVECPFNEIDSSSNRIVALSELQQSPDAPVLVFGRNADQMRVKIDRSAVHSGKGQSNPNSFALVERSQHLSTAPLGNDENLIGYDIDLVEPP